MSTRIPYQKELNPQQYAAVTAADGPSLVIAGAGSGKTRILVYRTAYLVERGIPPEQILLLTFTRKAAEEMLERAAVILDERCQRVAGGTFHSFANSILRRYGPHVGLPVNFTIMDQSDAENAVQMVCQQNGFRKGDKRFPRKQTLLSILSRAANKCVGVDAVLEAEYPHFLEWADAIFQIQQEYTRYKRRMALVDYDDLLVYLRDLLTTQENIGRQIAGQYRYLMVDEYQDTNKVQAEIVHGLAGEHRNVMVVGDDAQSIYSFRGAHFQNILRFPRLFAGTQTFYLEENYRSSQSILDLTNEVIRSAQERFDKVLFTKNKQGALPVYVDTPDENGQSRYIAQKIHALRDEGVPLNEIAVLFRSGWHSNDLEVELASQGIAFVKYGGQRFVEAAHIKDVMSYLQVAYNPFHELGWTRLLTLLRGIGPRSAAQIYQAVVQKQGLQIDAKYLKKSQELERLFQLLRQIDVQNMKPQEILVQVVGHYYPLMMNLYDDFDKRTRDLDSLQSMASRYPSLELFLTDIALDPPETTWTDGVAADRTGESCVLSTIHSAKGLEWHTVFIIFLADGYLPSYRSLESEEAIEEERRLFYVAATRARKNLFLLRPLIDRSVRSAIDGGSMYTRISRFLAEGNIIHRLVDIENTALQYDL